MPSQRRSHYDPLAPTGDPRWLVESDLWRTPLASRRLAPGADLWAALQAAVAERHADGWQAECGVDWGFVFINRGGERRLLALEHVDPAAEPVGGTYAPGWGSPAIVGAGVSE